MTDKKLQRLRRTDLIEILYYLSKENDELREENTKLREKLDAMLPGAAVGSSQESGKTRASLSAGQ